MVEMSLAKQEEAQVEIRAGDFSNWLDKGAFEHIQRVAKIFSESDLVPSQYKGKIANCIIGIQMAFRLNVDPFMFLQSTYVVHNHPGMEAKLAIALINSRGPFEGPIQWKFTGVKGQDSYGVTAYATHRKTGQICEAECTMALAKAEGWFQKEGSKWKTMPEMMLRYRSATFLGRLYAPECLMGMKTHDELYDMGPMKTIDAEVLEKETLVERLKEKQAERAETAPPPAPLNPAKRGRPPKNAATAPPEAPDPGKAESPAPQGESPANAPTTNTQAETVGKAEEIFGPDHEELASPEQASEITRLADLTGTHHDTICARYRVSFYRDLTPTEADRAIAALRKTAKMKGIKESEP